MLTYRTGAAGAPAIAKSMAEYLGEVDVPELQATMAKYYAAGMQAADGIEGVTAAMPRRDMHPALAERLGIDPNRNMSTQEVAYLLSGLRADGAPIEGRPVRKSLGSKIRLAYLDLTFSAPKSVSVSIALAENGAERAVIDGCHHAAVDRTMAHITKELGFARRGDGGKHGADAGHMAWVRFEHYTARPTAKIPRVENGVADTELVTVRGLGAGDMQRHTHTIVPMVVLTESGHVGAPDLDLTKNRIHEWGAIYQACLATGLREAGVSARLDQATGAAYLPEVPKWVSRAFSKRTWDSDEAAQTYAKTQGIEWSTLPPEAKSRLLKGGSKTTRNAKNDGTIDLGAWRKQATDMGYQHKCVLHPERSEIVPPPEIQIPKAWQVATTMLADEFYRRAKLEGHVLRTMAARSLIESGITSPADVGRVTKAFRDYGVAYGGEIVPLIWAREEGQRWSSATTGLHVDQENEAIDLLKKAAADRSSDLSPKAIQHAVDAFLARKPGLSFANEHGQLQRAMIDKLARSGRASMGVGAAGSGKTTVVEPMVDAWKADGRTIYGVTLAWRQTHELFKAGIGRNRPRRGMRLELDTDALESVGISKDKTLAMAKFIKLADAGKLDLGRKTVVVVDEAATIGTRQLLHVARLQDKHGFQLVGLADDKQCAAIEHGATVRMFRKALGPGQVPEIPTTVRQLSERDRETATLFREGKADAAIARKIKDGTLLIVPGNAAHAVVAAVDLWEERLRANATDPSVRVGISVPTNTDVRAIGEEIRRRRRAAGEVGADITSMPAQDQRGDEYSLALANGDRVRLFDRVYGINGAGIFGENGTVAEIVSMDAVGPTMKRLDSGKTATVRWSDLRDQSSERIRLTYGDALTIDTRQGDTVTDHILLMPYGSQAVNGFKGYTGDSRHRRVGYMITSQGAEKQEIEGRRPLGDPQAISAESIVANIARNLARQPEKVLATDFLDRADDFRRGTVRKMQSADFQMETRRSTGSGATNSGERRTRKQDAAAAESAADRAGAAARTTEKAVQRLRGPKNFHAAEMRRANRERRLMRDGISRTGPLARTKSPNEVRKEKPVPRRRISDSEAQAEFADALSGAGFRLKGAPIMDGKMHRVAVEGDKGVKKSGSYVGHLDGVMPAGYMHNFKTGEEIRWRASASKAMPSNAEPSRFHAAIERSRQAREETRRAQEGATASRAARIWAAAKPVARHPYLARKDVSAHGIKVDSRGRLLVPMRDIDGKIWNVQTINANGDKLFLAGRKQGLFTVLGDFKPDTLVVIAEGFATAATMREATGLSTVVAFDSGNLLAVAQALKGAGQNRSLVFAADNDHHLPRRDPPLPNVGLDKAEHAATLLNAPILAPSFDAGEKGTDWNDYAAGHGKASVRAIISAELSGHGIVLPPIVRTAHTQPSQRARDDARATNRTPYPATTASAADAQRRRQRPKGPRA